MKAQDKELHQLLKKLEIDFGWSFYDEKGELHCEDIQKQLIGDILRALKPVEPQRKGAEDMLRPCIAFTNRHGIF